MGGMTSAAVVNLDDVRSGILANAAPSSEATLPQAGTASRASRMDHVHERISFSDVQATNTLGVATFDFTSKPFPSKPSFQLSYEEAAAGQPVILKLSGWTRSGGTTGDYIGCTVTAQRASTIPTNLLSLLTGVGYNLFGASAAAIPVSLLLIPRSAAT